jgi:hypothetical protein
LRQASSAGLEPDEEDIFRDPNSRATVETWWGDPKAFERGIAPA